MSQMRQLFVFTVQLRWKWASSIHKSAMATMHPLQLYLEMSMKGQALLPVNGQQLLIRTDFVRETMHKFSQYVPHYGIGNTKRP